MHGSFFPVSEVNDNTQESYITLEFLLLKCCLLTDEELKVHEEAGDCKDIMLKSAQEHLQFHPILGLESILFEYNKLPTNMIYLAKDGYEYVAMVIADKVKAYKKEPGKEKAGSLGEIELPDELKEIAQELKDLLLGQMRPLVAIC